MDIRSTWRIVTLVAAAVVDFVSVMPKVACSSSLTLITRIRVFSFRGVFVQCLPLIIYMYTHTYTHTDIYIYINKYIFIYV